MFCTNCGYKLEDGSTGFCPECGTQISMQKEQAGPVQGVPTVQPPQPAFQAQQYVPPQPEVRVKKKKRSGCLTTLLVLVCLMAGIAAAAYFAVPGFFKPHDLGIKASVQAYESAIQKLGYTKDKSPTEGTRTDYEYTYGNPQDVDISLTSEEITSFLNINRPPYYAIKNVQVRINPDNTIEAAASLDVSYVLDYILDGKYNKKDAEKSLPMLGLLPGKVNVYSKFSGAIRNNKVDEVSLDKVSVMGIPIPGALINSADAQNFIEDGIDNYIQKETVKQNSNCELLEVNSGELVFKGQIPSSISRLPVR